MKKVFKPSLLIFAMVCLLSCDKDNDNVVNRTYIEFNVSGASMNGNYIIEDDGDINQLEATAVYAPQTPDDPATVILTYQDYNGLQVNLVIPGETGSTTLTDNGYFGISIYNQDPEVILESTNLNLEITRIKTNSSFIISLVDEMKGKFNGFMVFENQGEEESHHVEGNFEFAIY